MIRQPGDLLEHDFINSYFRGEREDTNEICIYHADDYFSA
jgi:hypothetical protein